MNLDELRSEVIKLQDILDKGINLLGNAATAAQDQIYQILLEEVMKFDITGGSFRLGQPYAHRFAEIQRRIEKEIANIYRPSVTEYLNTYSTIDQVNASIQRNYNQLEVSVSKLSNARQVVYNQAEYYLTGALNEQYVQPAKYVLMQQVTTGGSIKDSQRILRNWNDGQMTDGRLTSGRPTPALQRYATVIARDSVYKANSAVNDIIAKEYGLTDFVYVGNIIKDSRPLCRHLVQLNRIIALDEMPKLILAYPQGLYPGTDRDNFMQVCGGYGCIHSATAVRKR